MNNEKMKDYLLDEKEYNNITKIHSEFNKSIYGKKVKHYINILSVFSMIFIFMALFCFVCEIIGEKNFDIYGVICGALFFMNTSLILVSQVIYENMAMNYMNYKKR